MLEGLIETASRAVHAAVHRVGGVAVAQVVTNVDSTGQGRVQVRFPWLPGIEPWARVATMMAGSGRGTWFIPQPDDEVLVAFHHGDIREPYVIGSLWNGRDRPPMSLPSDAVGKRIIRTPAGHEIVLDDQARSITITSATKQKVSITPTAIELATDGNTSTVTLQTTGAIAVKSTVSIELKAPTITIEGQAVTMKGTAATVHGEATCTVKGGVVNIN